MLVTQRPAPVLIVVIALVAAGSAGLQHLGFDFSPQALFDTFEEERERHDRFTERFGHADNVLLVLHHAPDVLAAGPLAEIEAMSERLLALEPVTRVDSVTHSAVPRRDGETLVVQAWTEVRDRDVDAFAGALQASRLARERLFSADREVALLAVHLEERMLAAEVLTPFVGEVGALLEEEGAERWSMGGLPHVRAEVVERLKREQLIFIPITALIYLLVLMLIFRSAAGLVLPIATVFGSVGLTLGVMGWLGEPLNIINNTVPTLIFVIGISDSIHVLSRYEEERRLRGDNLVAIRHTVRSMAVACFLTTFTSAVGFASLLVSQTAILQRFGVVAAAGVLVAYAVTISLIPSALTRLGYERRASEGVASVGGNSDPAGALSQGAGGRVEEAMEAIAYWICARPGKVMAVGALFALLCIAGASRVVVDSAMLEVFSEGDPVHQQTRLLESSVQGVLPFELSLQAPPGGFRDPEVLNVLLEVAETMRGHAIVLGTWSSADVLRELLRVWTGSEERAAAGFTSRAQVAQLESLVEGPSGEAVLDDWVNFDRSEARLQLRIADAGGRATLALAKDLEALLQASFAPHPEVTWYFTGDAYLGAVGMRAFIRDLLGSLGMAVGIIFLFMALTFRSLRLGLLSIPANLLPLLSTLAAMGVLGVELNTTTVILFSISLGLAVDDTIHVLARYAEARHHGLHGAEAVAASLRGAGRAILLTSFLLVAGLLVLATSSFVPTQRFALLTSMTIAGCLIADIFLLPALLLRFGERRPQ